MSRPDSYDALAASIERALRVDLAPRESMVGLANSIEQTLLEEARTSELRIAQIRVVVVAAYAAFSLWTLVGGGPLHSAEGARAAAALGLGWGIGAVVLLLALRRGWYRLWIRHAAPVLDGLMIWLSFIIAWKLGGRQGPMADAPAAAGYVTALCGFLTVSGALRLSHSSAQLSTALSVAISFFASFALRLDFFHGAAIAATLLLLGALSGRVPALIRRTVTDQVGRLALSRMYEEARQAIDAREEVLKIVSHDLRNPLSTISMSSSLMLEVPLAEDQRKKQLSMIKRAGERMNRMIQDLLDVAKLEAGRLAIEAKPVEIAALLTEAEEMLRPLAADKGLTLETRVVPGLPSVSADGGRVLQVLSNLVGNAIKFTPSGGSVTIRAEPDGSGVRMSVADTGSGIPAEQLPRVFGRFWQANTSDRRGIGLGLAISKGIVEAHGGKIWVESRVGEGTTFYFTLPEDIQAALASARSTGQ